MKKGEFRWMRGLKGVRMKEQEEKMKGGWIIWWTKGSFGVDISSWL